MVTLAKSWVGPGQVAFSSSSVQNTQYSQLVYAIKVALLAVGWTVESSSNSVTASAADNWASAADVVHGTEASQVHSWICLIPPTTKGNPTGGSNFRLQLNCNVATATLTPQALDIRLARGTYGTGATNTRAAITGVEAAVLSLNVIPWTSAIAGSFCIWRTSDGDVHFGVKANSESFFRCFCMLRDDVVDAIGNYVLTLYGASSNSVDIVTANQFQTASAWRGLRADGTAMSSNPISDSLAWRLALNWPSGSEGSSGAVIARDVEVSNTSGTSADSRYFGLFIDCRGVPQNTAWMRGDLNDDGNALPFQLLTIGDIMIPCDSDIT